MLSEEVGGRVIRLQPAFFGEEAVDLIGENEFLEFDALFAKRFDQRHGLVERDITIVIAMDQQDR